MTDNGLLAPPRRHVRRYRRESRHWAAGSQVYSRHALHRARLRRQSVAAMMAAASAWFIAYCRSRSAERRAGLRSHRYRRNRRRIDARNLMSRGRDRPARRLRRFPAALPWLRTGREEPRRHRRKFREGNRRNRRNRRFSMTANELVASNPRRPRRFSQRRRGAARTPCVTTRRRSSPSFPPR